MDIILVQHPLFLFPFLLLQPHRKTLKGDFMLTLLDIGRIY